MMKKGFTLIELLAVIALIGILAVVATTSIIPLIKKSRNSLSQTQITTIEKAAEKWGTVNTDKMPFNENDSIKVSLADLATDNYLDSSDLKDPKDNSKLCGYVLITYTSKKQYTYVFNRDTC
jgi:prepilin-type N-terminal cleavage/methylation domain-containing protein